MENNGHAKYERLVEAMREANEAFGSVSNAYAVQRFKTLLDEEREKIGVLNAKVDALSNYVGRMAERCKVLADRVTELEKSGRAD